jgi:DNA-binding NtrC family response regulator
MISEHPLPVLLLIDDDPGVLRGLQIWLESEGFRVCAAADWRSAEAVVNTTAVDVALVDYRLQGTDGIAVAKKLHGRDPHLKIIIMTGFPDHTTAVQSIKAGAYDYLSKGTSNERILEIIKAAVSERRKKASSISSSSATTP